MFKFHWKPLLTSDLVTRKTKPPGKAHWKLDEIQTKEPSGEVDERYQWSLNIYFSRTMDWSIKTAPEEMITWTSPWWRLEHVTLCTYVNCVPILGFKSCTYYYSALVARQYRVKQHMPLKPTEFLGGRVSQRFIDHFRITWQKRIIHSFTTSDWENTTNKTYK